MQLYTTVPFASLIVFFALYLGIVQNQQYSRFVRFNGQAQAGTPVAAGITPRTMAALSGFELRLCAASLE